MTQLGITRRLSGSVADNRPRVVEALRAAGFGVLTEVDVAATLREKLGVARDDYLILGVCNPALAHRALAAVPAAGLLLPCNVTLRAVPEGTEVAVVRPTALLSLLGPQPGMETLAAEAEASLATALEAL